MEEIKFRFCVTEGISEEGNIIYITNCVLYIYYIGAEVEVGYYGSNPMVISVCCGHSSISLTSMLYGEVWEEVRTTCSKGCSVMFIQQGG